MATKDQYDFFKSLYETEERTAVELEGRAKVYLSIISAFLVASFLKTEDVVKSATALHLPLLAFIVLALFLCASLLLIAFALRIKNFEAVTDGILLIEKYGDTLPPDEIFYEDRIADFAVASTRNRVVNNHTATLLGFASYLISIGLLLVLTAIVVSTWRIHNDKSAPIQTQTTRETCGCDSAR